MGAQSVDIPVAVALGIYSWQASAAVSKGVSGHTAHTVTDMCGLRRSTRSEIQNGFVLLAAS